MTAPPLATADSLVTEEYPQVLLSRAVSGKFGAGETLTLAAAPLLALLQFCYELMDLILPFDLVFDGWFVAGHPT